MRKYRHTALALALAVVVTSSVGVAAQQTAAPTYSPPKPPTQAQVDLLNSVVSQNREALVKAAAAGQRLVASGARAAAGKSVVSGWNFAHATNCGWFLDGGGNEWFYIYPQEGGIVYAINDLYVSQGLQISCGDGNWFGRYVTNTNTGAYSQTLSYNYK
jgi:hypothetical protein